MLLALVLVLFGAVLMGLAPILDVTTLAYIVGAAFAVIGILVLLR